MADQQDYDLTNRKVTSGVSVAIVIGIAVVVLLCVAALVLSIIVLVKINEDSGTTTVTSGTTESPGGVPNINKPQVGNSPEFKMAAKFLLESIDLTANPCEDFYQHACGNYQKTHPLENNTTQIMSFGVIDDAVVETLVTSLEKVGDQSPAALQTAKMAYSNCVTNNAQYVAGDYATLKNLVDGMGGWPILTGATTVMAGAPSLETIMATLSGKYGIGTILSPSIDTKWKTPTKGAMMYLDQFSLARPKSYWNLNMTVEKENTVKEIVEEVKKYFTGMYTGTLNDTTVEMITKQAEEVANFEYQLSTFNKLSDQRRDYTKMDHPKTITEMQAAYPFFNWLNYFKMLYTNVGIMNDVPVDETYTIGLQEPTVYDRLKLSTLIKPENRVVLQNYLIWRWLRTEVGNFPEMKEIFLMLTMAEEERGGPKMATKIQTQCAQYVRGNFPYQAGRLYIEEHYKDMNARNTTRVTIDSMIEGVLLGFEAQLEFLDWMLPATRKAARAKVQGVIKNSLFPDWIMDDNKLNNDLNGLTLDAKDSFWVLNQKLKNFRAAYGYRQLKMDKTDRLDFLMSPAVVNAWYIPEYNSITFPDAIIAPPFFHLGYPAAVNYGAIGVVMGHELTHGFDDQGVQWGPEGVLKPWIDGSSAVGFKAMADCVINEYSLFCPRKDEPMCVKGAQTQGENIADNGGLRAAFSAYRAVINEDGEHDRLPGVEYYTNDQLFFLSFAQVWCRNVADSRLKAQLLTDVHAPAESRVRGAVRNFPAFAAAFNCKLGDPMFPDTTTSKPPRCNVWS